MSFKIDGVEIPEGGEKNSLMWFRSDLRVMDNRALEAAVNCVIKGQNSSSGLIALFLISIGEWKNHSLADIKVQFILRNLKELGKALKEINVPLIFKVIPTPDIIPSEILSVCKKYHIKNVFYNIEYEVNETKRDASVSTALKAENIKVRGLPDQCIVAPNRVVKSDKSSFTVYTPYKKAWLSVVEDDPSYLRESKIDKGFQNTLIKTKYGELFDAALPEISEFKVSAEMEKLACKTFPSGEAAAYKILTDFVSNKILDYKDKRDFPCLPNTSAISPYLSIGVISARQCANYASQFNKGKLANGTPAVDKWIAELVWREFYRYILFKFPRVSKSQPFRLESLDLEWSDNEKHFTAWKEGMTGYPLVDAGMRELKATGWLHNRVRMTTASFLTKDLHIHWQRGEEHFMRHLIDGDLASNNGGWQWAASTGTDPLTYLRIFNPVMQSVKFDPEGKYIKKWVPELKNVSAKHIHEPFKNMKFDDFSKTGYPKPIVNHSVEKDRATEIYNKVFTFTENR